MANEQGIYELLGRALAQPEFRERLCADPAAAAAELGITLSDEDLAAIKSSDFSRMAEGLDERLSKYTRRCIDRL